MTNNHPHDHIPLAELHSHLGGAAHASTLWTIAHEHGIKLPVKDYWEFEKMITIRKHGGVKGVTGLDKEKYHWTELIQSSPLAIEPTVHWTLAGAYRKNHVTAHEIRFNPMKRNREGERDLDAIITAAIRGMERAMFEYPEVRAGLIFMLGRTLPRTLNEIIYAKALRYKNRGVIGIDVADPLSPKFRMADYADLFRDAKRNGLGVTIHTGEEGSVEEMRMVANDIEPHRIGHGFLAWKDRALMRTLVEKQITLELCPTSNLNTGVIKSIVQLRRIYRTLFDAGVKLTINTDGPNIHGTNLWKEFTLLLEHKVFTRSEVGQLMQNAFDATFIR